MIKVIVQDPNGTEIGSFEAEKGKTITDLAQKYDVEIPFSCGGGACGLCLCEIVEGKELVNGSFLQNPLMQLHENEVLTCISAVKDEYFEKGGDYTIILKRRF
ncbi:MAG TPA: 2Fe-2S iron-sulfur cluster-binding protein [Candidatus Absconditabacterales bacterium]|nr:2Fe-2S iron-sulfur cluster-binding protein [Candidatus Absconditabacterales bacterium]HPK27652.1 2Fe-2S iron-sulfur cluster-binding protein [Candidatus Absconditabacterales bacterium]